MMGVAPKPQPVAAPAPPENRAAANMPTMPVPPNALPPSHHLDDAPALIRPPAAWQESGDANANFRPWDSRPVRQGDDEDWLR
jgi:hypothetical protein